jgi:hypothetical protein
MPSPSWMERAQTLPRLSRASPANTCAEPFGGGVPPARKIARQSKKVSEKLIQSAYYGIRGIDVSSVERPYPAGEVARCSKKVARKPVRLPYYGIEGDATFTPRSAKFRG